MNKKAGYNRIVLDVEKGCFTPMVFSTHGGIGSEAQSFFKRIAEKIVMKKDTRHTLLSSYQLFKKKSKVLVKKTLISLGGFRRKVL